MQFAFMLALQLGMTVGELLARMSCEEFELWFDFYSERPFGPEWEDVRSAHMTANLLSPHTTSRLKIADFMPLKRNGPRQSKAEATANMQMFMGLYAASQAAQSKSTPDDVARRKQFEELERQAAAAQQAKAVTHG